MTNPLEYTSTPVPDDCTFKISPSSFSKFISSIHTWYRDEVLKDNPFSHSTSTVIGTCVHYCAECIAKGDEPSSDLINEYIDSLEEHEDYNKEHVKEFFPAMAETLVNYFVIPNKNNYLEVEESKIIKVAEGVYVGGTPDALLGTKEDCMLIDYKTYSGKTKPRAIPAYYRYQLLVYCYILKKLGYNVTRYKLVYVNRYIDGGVSEKTGKPLKSYLPEITELVEEITEESLDFIESQLLLCADTLEASKNYPELRHVIFHDPRIKQEK